MAEFRASTAPAAKRYRRPFDADPATRLRQLAAGAWEVGAQMSEKQLREERVRETAYFLWVDAGRPAGRDEAFWLAAEKWCAEDAEADTADEDSFPASDPPSNTGIVGPE
jgi:hypothetical protein